MSVASDRLSYAKQCPYPQFYGCVSMTGYVVMRCVDEDAIAEAAQDVMFFRPNDTDLSLSKLTQFCVAKTKAMARRAKGSYIGLVEDDYKPAKELKRLNLEKRKLKQKHRKKRN